MTECIHNYQRLGGSMAYIMSGPVSEFVCSKCGDTKSLSSEPRSWTPCTAERYFEMLEILPPAYMGSSGFLVGEPATHRICTKTGQARPTYSAFVETGQNHYEGPDLTIPEFRALTIDDVLRPVLERRRWRRAREQAFLAGAYTMEVPAVTTGAWDTRAWCNHVAFNDPALRGFDDGRES